MKKLFLRKTLSLVLALALAVSVAPTVSITANAEDDTSKDVVFDFAGRSFLANAVNTGETVRTAENPNGTFDYHAETTSPDPRTITTYYANPNGKYTRNWVYFNSNVTTGGRADTTVYSMSSNATHFQFYQHLDTYKDQWAAFKIKGLARGNYKIKINNPYGTGFNVGAYILSTDTYENETVANISAAVTAVSEGVQKAGVIDFSQAAGYYTYDNAVALTGDENTEYILLFKYESTAEKTTRYYLDLYETLTFVYDSEIVAEPDNAKTFGNTAAYIEKTEEGGYTLSMLSGIESLDYSEVGFYLTVGDDEYTVKTNGAYGTLNITKNGENSQTVDATTFGLTAEDYVYIASQGFSAGLTGEISFQPYAIPADGSETIVGSVYTATLS